MNPWVMRLLIANVACFGLQMILPPFTDWFRFYAPFAVVRPWTFVTYMFLHGDPMHILFNMLGLYIFGSRVESRMGGSRFLQMYLIAGVVGALAHAVLSPGAPVVGASAAVYGVLMAYAMFWPRDRIYVMGVFPIEAWLANAARQFTDLRWELVTVKAKEDGSGVEVAGKVPAAKDLADLKAMLDGLEPKVQIDYRVTVGR